MPKITQFFAFFSIKIKNNAQNYPIFAFFSIKIKNNTQNYPIFAFFSIKIKNNAQNYPIFCIFNANAPAFEICARQFKFTATRFKFKSLLLCALFHLSLTHAASMRTRTRCVCLDFHFKHICGTVNNLISLPWRFGKENMTRTSYKIGNYVHCRLNTHFT